MTKPTATSRRPPAPKHLTAQEAVIWRYTTARLDQVGRLSFTDQHVLEVYCRSVVRDRDLSAEIRRTGMVDKEGKPHPLLRTIEATANTVKNLACTLGLTSGSRRALPPGPPASGNSTGDRWRGVLK
jgi:P27 family predicted phage terminase small subunit